MPQSSNPEDGWFLCRPHQRRPPGGARVLVDRLVVASSTGAWAKVGCCEEPLSSRTGSSHLGPWDWVPRALICCGHLSFSLLQPFSGKEQKKGQSWPGRRWREGLCKGPSDYSGRYKSPRLNRPEVCFSLSQIEQPGPKETHSEVHLAHGCGSNSGRDALFSGQIS